jgi:RNA-directed DNA polymerase
MTLAYRNHATYTRYCDDLTFSFSVKNAEKLPGGICSFDGSQATAGTEFQEIVEANGFAINTQKTRISGHTKRMEVTGLTINKFPNVQRRFVDAIRGALHAWDKYGYSAASDAWSERPYLRQRRTDSIPSLQRVLWGKLLYLKMVRSTDDLLYTKLAEKYNRLVAAQVASDSTYKGDILKVAAVVRSAEDVSQLYLRLIAMVTICPPVKWSVLRALLLRTASLDS